MSLSTTLLLGLIAGSTILLGMPIGRLRRPSPLTVTFLNAIAIGVLLFLVWDVWAAATDQWRFSPSLTTDLRLPYGVPIDEVLFFVVVPICGLLTLEAVRSLSRRRQ